MEIKRVERLYSPEGYHRDEYSDHPHGNKQQPPHFEPAHSNTHTVHTV